MNIERKINRQLGIQRARKTDIKEKQKERNIEMN